MNLVGTSTSSGFSLGGTNAASGDLSSLLPPTLETPYNKLPQQLKTEIDETYQHFIKPTRDVLAEIKSHLPTGEGQGDMNILVSLNDNINKASLNVTQLSNTQKRLQVRDLSFLWHSICIVSCNKLT